MLGLRLQHVNSGGHKNVGHNIDWVPWVNPSMPITSLILTTALEYCCHPHCTHGERKAQRGWASCSRSHSWLKAELGHRARTQAACSSSHANHCATVPSLDTEYTFWTTCLVIPLGLLPRTPGLGENLCHSLDYKESACQCSRYEFNPWVGKIPWRRKWQPTPVFLPG